MSCLSLLKLMLVATAIDMVGVEVLSLAAFLAAFGLGVGASISTLIQNFIAGVIIVVQQPIELGHYVALGGTEGTVLKIGMTHTILNTPERIWVTVSFSNFNGGARGVNSTKLGTKSHDHVIVGFELQQRTRYACWYSTGDSSRGIYGSRSSGEASSFSFTVHRDDVYCSPF